MSEKNEFAGVCLEAAKISAANKQDVRAGSGNKNSSRNEREELCS